MVSVPLANTRIYTETGVYIISTIDRDCSAPGYPNRYSETIIWSTDETGRMKDILHQESGLEGSILTHNQMASRTFNEGRFWEVEDDE